MVAEVASTVNEIILAENILKKEKVAIYVNGNNKRGFMEVPTVYEDVTSEYEQVLKKYFANIVIDEKHKYEWLRIPHFYSPYYVYKYATGISSAIYIARNILKGKEGYLEKYIEMLKTGGKVRKYRCFKNCRSRLRK